MEKHPSESPLLLRATNMHESFQHIAVFGLGYIGLPTAAVLASRGITVSGVDVNPRVVEIINSGKIHINEPDLEILVHATVQTGKLTASLTPQPADAHLIAVPTPFKDNHQPDLSYVKAAALSLAPVLKKNDLVILESTSPVGTTEAISEWLAQARPDLKFPHQANELADVNIAYCPERVLPGRIIHELMSNDRVIGGLTTRCAQRAAGLYRSFVQGQCVITTARMAEMCKLTENSYRDVSIAFANELSMICGELNLDVWELIALANRHPRVNILQPGPGVGGHCIAVDPWFIIAAAPEQAKLIRTAREVNESKKHWVITQLLKLAAELGKAKPTVACLGLTFKPDIDDLRESPALEIAQALASRGDFVVVAHEPHIDALPDKIDSPIRLMPLESCLGNADLVLLLVDHSEYKQRDWSGLTCPVLDTRGVMQSYRNEAKAAK